MGSSMGSLMGWLIGQLIAIAIFVKFFYHQPNLQLPFCHSHIPSLLFHVVYYLSIRPHKSHRYFHIYIILFRFFYRISTPPDTDYHRGLLWFRIHVSFHSAIALHMNHHQDKI